MKTCHDHVKPTGNDITLNLKPHGPVSLKKFNNGKATCKYWSNRLPSKTANAGCGVCAVEVSDIYIYYVAVISVVHSVFSVPPYRGRVMVH